MGILNTAKLLFVLTTVLLLTACPGPRGPQGEAGAGRIISTLNCGGTIVGQSGGASVLNGLQVEYDAVLTAGGDVYATAVVIDDLQQVSGTAFYAAHQAGAQTALVLITSDHAGAIDGGLWKISLDRATLKTYVEYDDPSLSGVVNMNFNAAACTVQYW